MPTIDVRGKQGVPREMIDAASAIPGAQDAAAARGGAAPRRDMRATPMLDPLKWGRALTNIERSIDRLTRLTAGTATAAGGVRLPQVSKAIERGVERLVAAERRRTLPLLDDRRWAVASNRIERMSFLEAQRRDASFRPLGLSGAGGPPYFGGDRGSGGAGGRGGGGRGFSLGGAGGSGRGLGSLLSGIPVVGALSRFAWPAAIAVGAYEAATLPQTIAGWARSSRDAAEPYMRLQQSTYSLGRAGGFSGAEMFRKFFPGKYDMPEWMRTLGATPDQAMKALADYGVVPNSPEHADTMARHLLTMEASPAYSGISPELVRGVARQGTVLGLGDNLTRFSKVMEDSQLKSLDRSQVLEAIKASLDHLADAGAIGIDAKGTADMIARMFSSNIPGARTGALEQQAISGTQAAIDSVGVDPARTMAIYRSMQQFGGLKTDEDLKGFFVNSYENLAKNPESRRLLENIKIGTNAGRGFLAANYVAMLLGGMPDLFHRRVIGQFGKLPQDIGDWTAAYLGYGDVKKGGMQAYLADLLGTGSSGLGDRTKAFMKGVDDLVGTRGQDVSSLVDAVIKEESGGSATARSRKGALGLMQLMPDTAKQMAAELHLPYDEKRAATDADYNKALGSQYLRDLLEQFGGNQTLALAAYNAGPATVKRWIAMFGDPRKGQISNEDFIAKLPFDETRRYVADINSAAGMRDWRTATTSPESLGLPGATLAVIANAEQQILSGAATSFHEFANGVMKAVEAVERFVTHLDGANDRMGSAPGGGDARRQFLQNHPPPRIGNPGPPIHP